MKKALLILVAFVTFFGLTPLVSVSNAKVSEKDVEKVTFIHYKKQNARPADGGKCYKLMGVKWPTTNVTYSINPTNSEGLSASFVTNTISTSAETWDAATSNELFNNNYNVDTSATYGVYDEKNSIAFGHNSDSNVIAVTSVWYTRVGKQIVEFDMQFNDSFQWGDASANSSVMDLQNIATHELGHTVGMADIYTNSCGTVTMYGYGTEGETAKRTLEQPDINGLVKMYGI